MESTVELFAKVTKVIDPHNFWMQIGTDKEFKVLNDLNSAINQHCNNTEFRMLDSVTELDTDRLVLVCDKENGKFWKRGQIARIDYEINSVDVLYIDYGETELVSIERLCRYYPKVFVQTAFQAIHCCLVGINPIAKSWTSRSIKVFKDLVENEILRMIIVPVRRWTKVLYPVALYANEEGRSVAHMLFDEEIGIPSDEQSIPEFIDDAAEFFKFVSQNSHHDQESDDLSQSSDCDTSDLVDAGSTLSDEPDSPCIIPTFDINQIDKTKSVSSNILLTKLQKEHFQSQKEEAVKINQQFDEEAALAVMAGYGGKPEPSPRMDSLQSPDIIGHIFDDIRSFSGTGTRKALHGLEKHLPLPVTVTCNPEFETRNGISSIARKEIRNSRELGINVSPTLNVDGKTTPDIKDEKLDFMQHFERILRELEKNSNFDWKLQMTELVDAVVSTDSFGVVNREQLTDAIKTLLKKAVRRFEIDHDIHLEILGMLDIFDNFNECILTVLGKLQELFIKVNTVGTQLHRQCSKIFGYIYVLCSTSWKTAIPVLNSLHASCEKWIVFNKKGNQLGQDKLQVIFLEAFEGFWEISHEFVAENHPVLIENLKQEIKEKLLNEVVARCVRERLLDILLRFFASSKNSFEATRDIACGNETAVTFHNVACQTSEKNSSQEKKSKSKARQSEIPVEWPALNGNKTSLTSVSPSPCSHASSANVTEPHSTRTWSDILKNTKDNGEIQQKQSHADEHQSPYDVWSSVFKSHDSDLKPAIQISEECEHLPESEQIETRNSPVDVFKSRGSTPCHEQSHQRTESPPMIPEIASHDLIRSARPVFYKTSPLDYKKLSSAKNLQSLAESWISSDLSDTNSTRSAADIPTPIVDVQRKTLPKHITVSKDRPSSALRNEEKCSGQNSEKFGVATNFDWFDMDEENNEFDMAKDKSTSNAQPESLLSQSNDEINLTIDDETNALRSNVLHWQTAAVKTSLFESDESSDDDENWTINSDVSVPKILSGRSTDVSFELSEQSSTDSSENPVVKRPKWIPGKRKCTACGDANHLIYDCPRQEKHSVLF